MDFSLIGAAATSLGLAKELGKTAVGLRDFNQLAGVVAQMNDQLLKAQESLFAHNAQLLELQQKYFEATQEVRKLQDEAAERGRYRLYEVVPGTFAYRSEDSDDGAPDHLICQPCFDGPNKQKVVLRRKDRDAYTPYTMYICPGCQTSFKDKT